MASARRARDPRYTKTIGAKPHTGRRYVVNGTVRIEWTEHGKRRSRTIGANTAETRRRADAELAALLRGISHAGGEHPMGEEQHTASFGDWLRRAAASAMDAADRLVEWMEETAQEEARADEAEAVEEEEPDESDR